jgi:hypothetical protein
MLGGFALVFSRHSRTFLVHYQGIVYEKDLGPDTARLARAI